MSWDQIGLSDVILWALAALLLIVQLALAVVAVIFLSVLPAMAYQIVTGRELSTSVKWASGIAATVLSVWFVVTHYQSDEGLVYCGPEFRQRAVVHGYFMLAARICGWGAP